jgi:hypothetical protein
MLTRTDIQLVSPALDRYTQGPLLGELWKRPDLSPRDRSIVTLAALIAPVDGPINDIIDEAYTVKYDGSPYLNPMIGERARSATVKVMPRDVNR